MPVLSKCPLCRGVMPESRGESRCPRCGELVLPAVRKLCAACGADVTHKKKVRDEAGEYFCEDCWAARLAARGEEPGYVCRTCHGVFGVDEVYQSGNEVICHACYADRTLDPNALIAAAASTEAQTDAPTDGMPYLNTRPYRRPEDPIPWAWVVGGIAFLLFVALMLVLYWSRN